MIKRIRLDLDDTLNTLSLDLLRFDGLEFESYKAIGKWHWGYNIINAVADLKGEEPLGVVEYWSRFSRDFWANIKVADEFDEIIDFCHQKVGLENVLITTSPTKCPECLAGKYEWMEKYLPKCLQRQYAITPRKCEYGYDTESVLIDDLPKNCHEYEERGGQAILVPRPWNGYTGMPVMKAFHLQWDLIEATLGEIS